MRMCTGLIQNKADMIIFFRLLVLIPLNDLDVLRGRELAMGHIFRP